MGPRNATTLIVALCTTLAHARTDAVPPATCVGRKLSPNVDQDSLSIDEAICGGKWRFGINASGLFGLWNGNKLTKKYSVRAYKLKLHEENDGEEVYISVYKKKGEKDPIWELKCENLSGEEDTKLMIHDSDSKNNVIRLKQGSDAQDKLWLVNKKKGEDKLGNDGNCKIDASPPISGQIDMIVLDENKRVCIGVNHTGVDLKQGDNLVLAGCDADDDSQRFILDDKGRIHPLLNGELCVDALETEEGDELLLNLCKTSLNSVWEYDQNKRDKTFITPSRDNDFCVAYKDDLHVGTEIVLDGCTDAQIAWGLVDASDYQDPYDQADTFQASRQFLRKMAKVVKQH